MQLKKFSDICDTAIFYSACGLIYFLPISTGLTEWGSGLIIITYNLKRAVIFFNDKKLSGSQTGGTWISRISAFFRAMKPAGQYLNRPIAIFIFVNFLAVVFSQAPLLSLKGFVFKLLQGTFVYFGFMEGVKTRKRLKIFLTIFLISAGLIGFNGLFQGWTGKEFIHGHTLAQGDLRIRSSMKHANDFGGYLLTVLPLVLSVIFLAGLPERVRIGGGPSGPDFRRGGILFIVLALVLLAVILISALGLTYSRGAWLGFLAALVFIGFFHRRAVFPMVLIGLLFCNVFFPKLGYSRQIRLLEMGPDAAGAAANKTGSSVDKVIDKSEKVFGDSMGRRSFWKESLAIIKDYPLLGAGLNTYMKIGGKRDSFLGTYPHNCFLQMTAETGIIGLLSFLWILAVLFRGFFRSVKSMADRLLRSLTIGLTAGMTGFLIQSFFDTNLYTVQLGAIFWLLMAVIVKIQTIGLEQDPRNMN